MIFDHCDVYINVTLLKVKMYVIPGQRGIPKINVDFYIRNLFENSKKQRETINMCRLKNLVISNK